MLLTARAGGWSVSCVCGGNVAGLSHSPPALLFCQELQCFPEERKLFHFQLLSAPECERRSFSNIRSFQLPTPSEQKYTPPLSWPYNSRWAQKNSNFLYWFNFPHQISGTAVSPGLSGSLSRSFHQLHKILPADSPGTGGPGWVSLSPGSTGQKQALSLHREPSADIY